MFKVTIHRLHIDEGLLPEKKTKQDAAVRPSAPSDWDIRRVVKFGVREVVKMISPRSDVEAILCKFLKAVAVVETMMFF